MGLWEASFRCQYEFPLVAISSQLPATPLYAGCLGGSSWVQVPDADEATVREVSEGIRHAGGRIVRSQRSGDSQLFIISEPWSSRNGLHSLFQASQCRLAMPWMYQDGWGYFRVLSLEDGHLRAFFAELGARGDFQLIRKSELPLDVLPTTTWIQGVFSNLTAKQAESILEAHRAGYYRSPRRVTRGQIARELGVGRTTLEEHIRKAERKIMNALVPHLSDYTRTDRPVTVRWQRGERSKLRRPPPTEPS
jgi:predicted DNA binding protein